MANKTISMGEAIEALSDKMKQEGGNFSARLDEIVERYSILLDLEVLPDFSPEELTILGEVICGSVINRRKVRGLHLDVLDTAIGTKEERDALSAKVEEMTAGQRLKLIETLGQ
ncbi:hypothetical protein AAAV92_07360 [Selenomonas noxia]|uniref:hypothetical protein n=1 Tax=Selenomonas noxia TaxID=135083 RepID=UPI0032C05F1B